jgi:hypothetical protein
MVFVVLCGGLGTRATQGTLPKPLTPLLGAPSLKYALEHVAPHVGALVFIYAAHLAAFNFEETVINLFPRVTCTFACVPFATRGAVETAMAGMIALALDEREPVVFLDNDNVYPASIAARGAPAAPFLSYDDDATGSLAFSYMTRDAADGGRVTAVAEKRCISTTKGTGAYGFASVAQFMQWGRHTLEHGPFPNNEIFMSSLFVNMIAAGVRVESEHAPVVQLGTAALANAFLDTRPEKLRLCFDLDGTLVTPPRVPGDYSTVQPVESMIAAARWGRAAGHTIIVHTTRVCGSAHRAAAPGQSMADIGRQTFEQLARLDIPFDEVIFGKPHADVYFDSRSVNPFLNSARAAGLPLGDPADAASLALPNVLPNNKYNSLRIVNGRVVKRGPAATMRGEAFFYASVPALGGAAAALFPAFHGTIALPLGEERDAVPLLEITLDLVKGVPLTTMMRAGLLAAYHVDAVVAALDALHACASAPVTLALDALRPSYVDKMRARFADAGVYAGRTPDARTVLTALEARLARYTASAALRVAPVIHGDAWFANIILTPANGLKFIDMRGLVSGEETLNGDATADWAKLLQSVLGFDEVVFALPRAPHAYRVVLARALGAALRTARADPRDALDVCLALVAGSLHAYDDEAVRAGLWALVARALEPSPDAEWAELFAALCGDEAGR